jgi:superfamily II DNA/RNA helicase
VFETAARDKLVTLRDVLARHRSKNMRTLIFCNTVQSCHAVEYAINQDTTAGGSFGGDDTEIHATSYHGDLNSAERAKNLDRFRSGERFICEIHIRNSCRPI